LSQARQGRTPALGMKHSDENKRYFSECSKRREPKYPKQVTEIPFKEASEKYGISKTHYYRLLKRAGLNETS
jgi:hypothetical protein